MCVYILKENFEIGKTLLLFWILKSHATLETIKIKFLVPGQSFLANDDDFGDIEYALKLQSRLYSAHYIKVMKKVVHEIKWLLTRWQKINSWKQLVSKRKLQTERELLKENLKVGSKPGTFGWINSLSRRIAGWCVSRNAEVTCINHVSTLPRRLTDWSVTVMAPFTFRLSVILK